jgi:hypothetical protein
VRINEELFNEEVVAPFYKTEMNFHKIRYGDHATLSDQKVGTAFETSLTDTEALKNRYTVINFV